MSTHSSFSSGSGLSKHRNVLTRAERIERLKAENRWDRSKGITGLPKVRSIKMA
ncbi:MAG: small basic protein [Planctomycetota bacterium]|nr:MAG: small basic protein [Planctomycetota bacterium]